jgi:hypothetical protein
MRAELLTQTCSNPNIRSIKSYRQLEGHLRGRLNNAVWLDWLECQIVHPDLKPNLGIVTKKGSWTNRICE